MNALRNHFVVLLSASSVALYGCARTSPAPAEPPTVTGLAVAQAQQSQTATSVDAEGTVHARESAVLSSQVMGRVTSVLVHEGDQVRSGQLMVALDNAQAVSEIEGARANIASSAEQVKAADIESSLAKSTLSRYQILRDRRSVSPQEFDEVQRRSESALARLESARSMMIAAKAGETGARAVGSHSRLLAPFAGTVTARHVDPGAMATPGMPLLEIDKSGPLQLGVTVDESLLPLLRQGMQIPITVESASTQPLRGRIAEIVPAADPASHSFLIKVDLPVAAGLRSGMFGTAGIATKRQSPLLLVPQSALVVHGSLNSLWVLDRNHIASLRYVTIGAKHDANFEVLSGLSSGEVVVISPGDRELGGKRIEVSE